MNTAIKDFHDYSEAILQDIIGFFLQIEDPDQQEVFKHYIQMCLYFYLCQMSAIKEINSKAHLFVALPFQHQLEYWAERAQTYYEEVLRSEIFQNSFTSILNYYVCWLK